MDHAVDLNSTSSQEYPTKHAPQENENATDQPKDPELDSQDEILICPKPDCKRV